MLLIVAITLISVYCSLVIGTNKKFKVNGFTFSPFLKFLSIFLPAAIIIFHIKMALELIGEDKHAALEVFKMGTLKYPIAVGILIEVALEKFAHKTVYGDSYSYIKTPIIKINAGTVNKQSSVVFNIYEKTTVGLVAEC